MGKCHKKNEIRYVRTLCIRFRNSKPLRSIASLLQEDAGLFPKDADDKLIPSDVDYLETWQAFEEFVDEGLCKAIGVSNFNSEQVQRVLDNCRIKPAMNQVTEVTDVTGVRSNKTP